MAIKVTLGTPEVEEKSFPKLMISQDGRSPKWIVEVYEKDGRFTAIHRAGPYVGIIATDFELDPDFVDYNEPVIIQNA